MDIQREKSLLRSRLRKTIAEADKNTLDLMSADIYTNLLTIEEVKKAETVFCYISVGGEPDTLPLIRHLLSSGKKVAVPKCYSGGRMEAKLIKSLSDAVPVPPYGIPEPGPDTPTALPESIDIALIPGMAFDRLGGRLGKGAGYYDRYLEATDAVKCGVCFSFALLEGVPEEKHDMRMDILVTENEILRLK